MIENIIFRVKIDGMQLMKKLTSTIYSNSNFKFIIKLPVFFRFFDFSFRKLRLKFKIMAFLQLDCQIQHFVQY